MVASLADISESDLNLLLQAGDEETLRLLSMAAEHPYYAFQPREDDPSDFDEQTSFVNDHHSAFAVCLGGTGSGKTLASAHKTARYVLEKPPQRPRLPFWIIGESFDQICQVAWVEKLATIIPPECIYGFEWYSVKRRWPRAVLLKHPTIPDEVGWILEFKSYEQGFGGMKAISIGGYWCNEELPYHLLFEIQGRCRDYSSPGWADFTPVECKDGEWLDAYENPPKGWAFYHLNNKKNTARPDGSERTIAEWAEDYLETVPEELRDMRQYGKFTQLRGAVFKEFRKSLHVIDPTNPDVQEAHGLARHGSFIPRDWRKVRGLDFGFNNPTACIWIAKNRDGTYYAYDEHYQAQTVIVDHVKAINKREWDNQPWYGPTYSDHDAQARGEYALNGIACTPAKKDRNSGIELLRSLMLPNRQGKPRLYIFANCKNLIRETIGYRWPEGTTGRNPNDEPLDKDDHTVDALRYGIFSDFGRGLGHKPETASVRPDHQRHGVMFSRRQAAGRR